MRERNRFLRGMTVWVGFTQTAVAYERDARYAGETKYTLARGCCASRSTRSRRSRTRRCRPRRCSASSSRCSPSSAIPLDVVARYADMFVPGVRPTSCRPAARRDPADHRRDHRRVRRARSTTRSSAGRSTSCASASTSRRRTRLGARRATDGEDRRPRRRGRAASSPRTGWRAPGTRSTSTSAGPGSAARRRRSTSATATCSSATTTTCSPPTATSPRSTRSSGWRTRSSGCPRASRSSRAARLHPFTTPLDLLRFRPLRRCARVRMGARGAALQRFAGDRGAVRAGHRARLDRAADGPRGLGGGLGAAAARQVRRARRRDLDGLAVEQAPAAPPGQRARTARRSGSATRAAAGSRCSSALARSDRGGRRARADRPAGGAA